ncbi:MAG: endonuclease domain-containing protein [bacterium]|nr:endonuclease domain-containing protein [bacterium]
MKDFLTPVARSLRKQRNPHEVTMWARLRNRQFLGLKFHRQFLIGPYIVDFCCWEKRLVIELDGGGHDEPKQRMKDDKRDVYLTSQGFRVVRIWTSEMEAGLEKLFQELQAS